MKGRHEPMDCRRALKIVHGLFYGGAGILLLAILTLSLFRAALVPLVIILSVLGIVSAAAAILLGCRWLRCPRCGASLLLGGRIPSSLPNFCPACGAPLA